MSTGTRSASQQDSNTLWREKLVIGHDPDRTARCRRWVIRRPKPIAVAFPFCRQERTFQILRTIALGQKRTSVRYASGAPQEACVALPEVT